MCSTILPADIAPILGNILSSQIEAKLWISLGICCVLSPMTTLLFFLPPVVAEKRN